MDKNLMEYFIERTDKRFDSIESKLEEVLRFKWRIAGALAVISILVTVGMQILFKLKGA
jgi:hypothetical protein